MLWSSSPLPTQGYCPRSTFAGTSDPRQTFVTNNPQWHNLKDFFFCKPVYFGQNWIKGSFTWAELRWGWGKDLSSGLWHPRSSVQWRVWLQPGFNLRAPHFNFADIIKVAAFVVALLVLFQQVCRQRLLCCSVKKLIARFSEAFQE